MSQERLNDLTILSIENELARQSILMSLFFYIFENDTDAETSLAATSLLASLQTKKFVILLVFFGKLYEYSDFCTEAFQKSTETVSSCLILLAELRERLVNFEFYKVVEYAKESSDKYAIENFDVRGTTRKRSSRKVEKRVSN